MTKQNQQPIGIFDSGVGGLTVYKAIKKLLPQESFVYLGDTARVPYGSKSRETVMRYALQDSLFLLDHQVKLIVVGCNTASSFALNYLQSRLKVPVLGVIEPGVQLALAVTNNKRIGIIGTEGTITSQVYENLIRQSGKNLFCLAKATPLFVSLVEEGILDNSRILDPIFDHYLIEFKKHEIDTLILGCTHYPHLKPALDAYFSGRVHLVDSAEATAVMVKKQLSQSGLLCKAHSNPSSRVYVTDVPQRVERIAGLFLGEDHIQIQKADLSQGF